MASTTSSGVPSPTASPGGGGGGGPTSSPLLFFVALGFGVVFTNLWIIVGVKYCFRYNQRQRQMRAMGENGEPIDLTQMPRPHRRRREKKLMTMEEVNERFPLAKYKAWRSTREAEGLPAAGGVSPRRAASVKDMDGTIAAAKERQSDETARPPTAISLAREEHAHAVSGGQESSAAPAAAEATAHHEKHSESAATKEMPNKETTNLDNRNASVATADDEEDDDPIGTAAPPEMLAAPGDSCAICLDTLEDDDDVRGLTCGHAFHAACVDPWLTSRRACCPLCKADYYVPKPRADGSEDPLSPGGRRTAGTRGMNLPQNPQPAWMGARGVIPFRRRLFVGGPRFFVTSEQDREMYMAQPSRSERRRRERVEAAGMGEATGPRPEGEQQTGSSGWRSRLPNVFGRRNQSQAPAGQHGAVEEVASPGDLEAGRNAR